MTTAADSFGDVMVLGAGISGIQAALDLATAGYRVFLVEKAPTVGGKMAQLDKTFPTNDCSMCIESPKFIECDRHPNIEILTHTEVKSVAGEAGNFSVTLTRKPRYVNEDLCTGCTTCNEYCPIPIPDPFNQELSANKAIHIYFAQAVPLVPYIDDRCRYLEDGKCSICESVCKNKAIDLHQQPREEVIKVGAIVLSPGYGAFDPRPRGDYGYGTIQNVVTSLDFERLLCATGPHEGEILRPSDKKHPHKIAWIHCVGSRQVLEGGHSYCSAVCCAYVQKQVILTKDHDADTEAVIFHNDIRSYGKDFERFYERAKNLPGVRFERSYVSIGREIPETKNVTIRYSSGGAVKEEEFDLVVLGVGLEPPADAKLLAQQFGVELDAHGFCKTDPDTSHRDHEARRVRLGRLQGTDGHSRGRRHRQRRGRHVERAAPLAPRQAGPRPRLSGRARYRRPKRSGWASSPATAARTSGASSTCRRWSSTPRDSTTWLTPRRACSSARPTRRPGSPDTIREKGLNRVVVAACTPRTHEPLFRDTLREGGINQYFFDMANIREHCSWVHSKQKEEATAEGQGHRPHVRGARRPPGAAAGVAAPGHPRRARGRRGRRRDDLRAQPRRPGLRGRAAGEGHANLAGWRGGSGPRSRDSTCRRTCATSCARSTGTRSSTCRTRRPSPTPRATSATSSRR